MLLAVGMPWASACTAVLEMQQAPRTSPCTTPCTMPGTQDCACTSAACTQAGLLDVYAYRHAVGYSASMQSTRPQPTAHQPDAACRLWIGCLAGFHLHPGSNVWGAQVLAELVYASTCSEGHVMCMDQNLTCFADSLGTCERLVKTPIPLSYTRCFPSGGRLMTGGSARIWFQLCPEWAGQDCNTREQDELLQVIWY